MRSIDTAPEAFRSLLSTLALGAPALERSTALGETLRADALEVRGATLDATLAPQDLPAAAPARASRAPLPRVSIAEALDDEARAQGALDEAAAGVDDADLVVRRALGEGGMGVVHLAAQRSLGRDVAIKRVRGGAGDPSAALGLLREGQVTGGLEHPNIVPVHLLGLDAQGAPVLVMKRVEGVVWRALLDEPEHPAWRGLRERYGDDPLRAHLAVLEQLCDALAFAHARGVVHRDLKPENVMLGSFGEVYLLDWGLALRVGDEGEREALAAAPARIVGTPLYLAPEMVSGRASEVTERTDVYLLGAALHEVLTGAPPHDAPTLALALLSAYESAPRSYGASTPDELAALCNAALARDPAARPASALAFRARLAAYLRHRNSDALARESERLLDGVEARDAAWLRGSEALSALAQARFGLLQALREWPENARARSALTRCLRALLARELALENAEAAAALCDELGAEAAPQRPAVDALFARRARDEALRREARERDPASSAAVRKRVAYVLIALTVPLLGQIAYDELVRRHHPPMRDVALSNVGFFALSLAGIFAFRRKLAQNRHGMLFVGVFVASLFGVLLSDLYLWHRGLDASASGAYTPLVFGVGLLCAGLAGDLRSARVTGVLQLFAAALAAFVRPLSGLIATAASLVTIGIVLREATAQEKRRAESDEG